MISHEFPDLIVLGGGLHQNGEPSLATIKRAEFAAKLSTNNTYNRVIFSGGYSDWDSSEHNAGETEAVIMEDLARSKGMPEPMAGVLREENSRSTTQNFNNITPFMGDTKDASVVTSRFHIPRVRIIAPLAMPDTKLRYYGTAEPIDPMGLLGEMSRLAVTICLARGLDSGDIVSLVQRESIFKDKSACNIFRKLRTATQF